MRGSLALILLVSACSMNAASSLFVTDLGPANHQIFDEAIVESGELVSIGAVLESPFLDEFNVLGRGILTLSNWSTANFVRDFDPLQSLGLLEAHANRPEAWVVEHDIFSTTQDNTTSPLPIGEFVNFTSIDGGRQLSWSVARLAYLLDVSMAHDCDCVRVYDALSDEAEFGLTYILELGPLIQLRPESIAQFDVPSVPEKSSQQPIFVDGRLLAHSSPSSQIWEYDSSSGLLEVITDLGQPLTAWGHKDGEFFGVGPSGLLKFDLEGGLETQFLTYPGDPFINRITWVNDSFMYSYVNVNVPRPFFGVGFIDVDDEFPKAFILAQSVIERPGPVTFSAEGSTDREGPITYEWTWNQQTKTGPTAQYNLPAGQHQINLTVTDTNQQTDTTTHNITVQQPIINQPPTAAIAAQVTNLCASFDGTGSHDPDGDALTYTWALGALQGTGRYWQACIEEAGDAQVSLVVSDGSLTDSATQQIAFTNPPFPQISIEGAVPSFALAAIPATDFAQVAWFDGALQLGVGANLEWDPSPGSYELRVEAVDHFGQSGGASRSVSVSASSSSESSSTSSNPDSTSSSPEPTSSSSPSSSSSTSAANQEESTPWPWPVAVFAVLLALRRR